MFKHLITNVAKNKVLWATILVIMLNNFSNHYILSMLKCGKCSDLAPLHLYSACGVKC